MSILATGAGSASPWFETLNRFGLGMADKASESLQALADAKIKKELSRHGVTQTQTELDASANENANAARAPVKGQDADGGTLVEIPGINMKVKQSTLKTVGIASGVLLVAALAYKQFGG